MHKFVAPNWPMFPTNRTKIQTIRKFISIQSIDQCVHRNLHEFISNLPLFRLFVLSNRPIPFACLDLSTTWRHSLTSLCVVSSPNCHWCVCIMVNSYWMGYFFFLTVSADKKLIIIQLMLIGGDLLAIFFFVKFIDMRNYWMGSFSNAHCLTTNVFYFCHLQRNAKQFRWVCARTNVVTGSDLWHHKSRTNHIKICIWLSNNTANIYFNN